MSATLSEGDMQRLVAHDWPGNVRELQNVIERAAILARQGRARIDLPEQAPRREPVSRAQPASPAGLLTEADRRERDRANILAALEAAGGKISGPGGAAEILGLKPTTLASRIRKLEIAERRSLLPLRD
jgi:transcriptional regulator with GAF, ATPase, and Fis domain